MLSHGLQTLRLLCWPNILPDTIEVHFESKICPHVRQWCFRLKVVKASPQLKQALAFSSRIQNSRSRIFRRIWVKALRDVFCPEGAAWTRRCISSIGATAGVRIVDVVAAELSPSEEEALEARNPGRCDGPTESRGGRSGSGLCTGPWAFPAVWLDWVASVDWSNGSLALLGAERGGWYWLSVREVTLLKLSRDVSAPVLNLAASLAGASPLMAAMSPWSKSSSSCRARSLGVLLLWGSAREEPRDFE